MSPIQGERGRKEGDKKEKHRKRRGRGEKEDE